MGGSLAVTICDPEGKWHKMDRWTNPTSSVFTDGRFINGDMAFINQYLAIWYEMCQEYDDYISGKGGKPAMALVYCNPDDGARDAIAPSEYGLVYIDFPNKRFWSMQSYTSYDMLFALSVMRDGRDHMDEYDMAYYESILPRIISTRTLEDDKTISVAPVSFTSVKELVAHATALGTDGWVYYLLDMSGWDYREFKPDADGAVALRDAVQQHHVLTEKETIMWAEWIDLYAE